MIPTYKAIGMMSGTSMDGIDLVYAHFTINEQGVWSYAIQASTCMLYTVEWLEKLRQLIHGDAISLIHAHYAYGHYIAACINTFLSKEKIDPTTVDLIAFHGQTLYHAPQDGVSCQLGDGAAVAIKTGIPVVADLRSSDLAAGGQGAPIVPIGDRYLFADYRFCLNIGGIANISYQKQDDTMLGYDICGANLILNRIAAKLDLPYDKGGQVAATGKVHLSLWEALNALPFFQEKAPKSLGDRWVREAFMPLLAPYQLSPADELCTVVEHIAFQVGEEIKRLYAQEEKSFNHSMDKLLVTGGGAYNHFLIDRIRAYSPIPVVVPDAATIDYKEALVMAFIGVLRWRKTNNCVKEVTGAAKDVCGGAVYLG